MRTDVPAGPRVLDCTHRVTRYHKSAQRVGRIVWAHYRKCDACKRIVLCDGMGKAMSEEVVNRLLREAGIEEPYFHTYPQGEFA